MEKKLSIVIPVFDAGSYLADCLKSIVGKVSVFDRRQIEIVLVDDCSTDNSLELARQWQKQFPDAINIIEHRENMGPGGARQTGLIHATGEYVVFIDADDWYAEDALDKFLSVLPLSDENEILIFEFKALRGGKEIWSITNEAQGTLTTQEALYLFSIGKIVPSVCNKVFPLKLARSVGFMANTYYEDVAFSAIALSKASSVRFLNENLLFYRGDGASITRQQIKPRHINDLSRVLDLLTNVIPNRVITSNIFMDRWLRVLIAASKWGLDRNVLVIVLESITRYLRQNDLKLASNDVAIDLENWLTRLYEPYQNDSLIAELQAKVSVWLEQYTAPTGPFFSIIIPVFNAERFLGRAIENFALQRYPDFEVIFVNDQSTDRSREIIIEAATKYDFIRYVELPVSSGAGVARNAGLAAARGKYIIFNDSDDWFDPNGLETLKAHIDERWQPDLILFSFSVFDENGNFLWGSNKIEELHESTNTGERLLKRLCDSTVNPSPWNKAFKRSVWTNNNIQFPPEIHHQDLATIPYACFKAKKVTILRERLYNYCTNLLGVTQTATDKHAYSPFKAMETLFGFFARESDELLQAWKDDLVSLALETFSYNFKIRKDKFKDDQIVNYIRHFNAFCQAHRIDAAYLFNCPSSFALLRSIISEKTKRGLSQEISCFADELSFERMVEHYAIMENQASLAMQAGI